MKLAIIKATIIHNGDFGTVDHIIPETDDQSIRPRLTIKKT